jgi:hypothetical protein
MTGLGSFVAEMGPKRWSSSSRPFRASPEWPYSGILRARARSWYSMSSRLRARVGVVLLIFFVLFMTGRI